MMTTPLRLVRTTALTALILGAVAPAQTKLELGRMWTFENPPLAYLEEEYGFAPTPDWFDALRLASLRFGNWCSASFVSPKGLIMTNHHCVRDAIAENQPQSQDWVKNGFYAGSLQEEHRLENVTVQQLAASEDVTARMVEGIASGDSDAAAKEKLSANEERILEQAREQHPGLDPEVVTLHQGAVYQLYLYKVYEDVRLVCSPHLQTAHFGGDPDNFTYPRYSLDFSFCRAYENGEPADTSKHHFKWSMTGAAEKELVFVTGNPGSTGRLLTYSQMEFLRDADYPINLEMITNRLRIMRALSESNPTIERVLRTIILGDENSQKAVGGYLGGLHDAGLMEQKRNFEQEFRAKVKANPELDAEFGEVWDKLAEVSRQKTTLQAKLAFHSPSYEGHLATALAIVRAVNPDLSDEERAEARELANEPVSSNPLYQALFIDHLARARRWLPPSDPYLSAVMGELDPASAHSRMAASFVEDPRFVAQLLEGGQEAVQASDDAAVVAALAIAPLIDANFKLAEELDAQEAALARQVGRALFACYGDKISPDATMTLRFSDGVVAGYPYNGTLAPYRTTFYGLYARNVEFGDTYPFNLPAEWLDKKDAVDLSKAVNFVSTNDIIGGNSGSPVVNKDLEVVGLIFDGNIEQLPNRFLFRDTVQRSVSVHVDAIIEALKKIYGADRVVQELGGN